MNNVVLGDLSLDGRNDATSFDGVDDRADTNCVINGDHRIELDFLYEGFTGSLGYLLRASTNFTSGVYLFIDGNSFRYTIYGASTVIGSTGLAIGQRYSLVAEFLNGVQTLTVNETYSTITPINPPAYSASPATVMGRSSDNTVNVIGQIYNCKIFVEGVKCADFPSGTFGSNPMGDGTALVNGAQWWKQGVDEQFDTEQLYKSTFVSPMVESQTVTDYLGNYTKTSPFWNDYNIDPVYAFNITSPLFKGSASVIRDAFGMLENMTLANGFSRDYTPVQSVYNASAKQDQTPYIGVHTEPEEPYDGPTGFGEVRSVLPIVVTARVRPILVEDGSRVLHKNRSEIEYAEDIARGEVRTDMKRRFQPLSYREFTSCSLSVSVGEEIDPESNGLNDSNKHDMFVQYRFYVTYKETIN